jgi:hypothetical protein
MGNEDNSRKIKNTNILLAVKAPIIASAIIRIILQAKIALITEYHK